LSKHEWFGGKNNFEQLFFTGAKPRLNKDGAAGKPEIPLRLSDVLSTSGNHKVITLSRSTPTIASLYTTIR